MCATWLHMFDACDANVFHHYQIILELMTHCFYSSNAAQTQDYFTTVSITL